MVNGSEITTYTYDGDGNLVQRVGPEGKTLYVGRHLEVFVPADAPPPEPTPTPSPSAGLTHTVYLPLLRGGCGYLVDGRVVPPTRYYLFNGKRVASADSPLCRFTAAAKWGYPASRTGCNGPVTCSYHDHPLVAPSGLPASGLVPPAPVATAASA